MKSNLHSPWFWLTLLALGLLGLFVLYPLLNILTASFTGQ